MVHTRDLRHEPWRYRLRAFVSKPANLLLVFFLIVLVVLSLLPMATILSNMFTVHVGPEKKPLCLPVHSTPPYVFSAVFALCVAAWADCARCFSVGSAERCLLKFLSTLFLRSSAEGLVVWMNAVTSPFAC